MDTLSIAAWQTALSTLSLETIKQLVYLRWKTFSINILLYPAVLAVLGFAWLPVASWFTGGPLDWSLWNQDQLRQTLILVVTTLLSMVSYDKLLKPAKDLVGLK